MIDVQNLCQIEILVDDMEKSLEFYREVFGWQEAPAEIHEYKIMQVSEGSKFGVSLVPNRMGKSSGNRSKVVLYFRVEDPQAIVKKAERFGGRLVLGPKELPSYGTIYQIEDVEGNRFGLFV